MAEENKIVVPTTDGPEGKVDTVGQVPDPPYKEGTENTIDIDDHQYNVDKDGNAVDDTGEVFKTKEELDLAAKEKEDADKSKVDDSTDKEDEVEQLDIDGVMYTINEEGAAIDDKGVVKYTKEQLEGMQEVTDDVPEINVKEIAEKANVVLYDEEGNPMEFDNTEEGLTNFINKAVEQIPQQAVRQEFDNFFNSYPLMRDVFLHLQTNNGSLEGFNKTVDYGSVSLDKGNEQQLKNIIYSARAARGDTPEMIDDYYKYLYDSSDKLDKVYSAAEKELNFLKERDKQVTTQQQEYIQQQNEAAIEKEKKYWGVDIKGDKLVDLNVDNSVYGLIQKGELKIGDETYTIPDKIRVKEGNKVEVKNKSDFFNYLFVPRPFIIDGQRVSMTEDEYRLALEDKNKNVNDDLFGALKRFTKYDTSQFIKEQINNEKTKAVKKLTARTPKGTKESSRTSTVTNRIVVPKNN